MIKFETINGTLCLMLEKAVPLTEDAKFPCVVRLIQDDSPMGTANKIESPHSLNAVLFATHIDTGGFYPKLHHKKPNSNVDIEATTYYNFEIIGYPVADHSAEWAIQRMLLGDKVCHMTQTWNAHSYKDGMILFADGMCQSADSWLRWTDATGWQLYEPKPLLAEAKVGDLCQRSNGRYTQFHSKHKLNDGTIAYYFDDVSGSTNIDGDHCSHECGNNIVSCEPLAPIGSAEWALQMMKLGKDVCRKGHETAYYHICNDGKEIACSLKNERRLTCGHLLVSKWGETGNDWKLYDPKQEPKPEHPAINGYNRYDYVPVEGIKQPKSTPLAVQVGDYVRTANGDGKVIEVPLTMPEVMLSNGQRMSFHADEISGISPAEVRVKITLEGTVQYDPCDKYSFSFTNANGVRNRISYNTIDPATAELVRELIEKQQGENK